MNWSANFPIEPGWYWFRISGHSDFLDIVRLREGDIQRRSFDIAGNEWAGPMPEPAS